MNVIDEYTRECPAVVVARSIDADAVVATLDRLAAERGALAVLAAEPGTGHPIMLTGSVVLTDSPDLPAFELVVSS